MRPRCTFQYVGRPTTAPNTPADAKRIVLSQWLTRLIGDGDAYVTPGANGYTADELASAPVCYAHLGKEKPAVPEAELQLQALALLRAGVASRDIPAELDIVPIRLAEWRKVPAFQLEWDNAMAEGKGLRPRSSPARDAAAARRAAEPEELLATPNALPAMATKEIALQQCVLELLAAGTPSADVLKRPGMSGMKLASWRKDPDFAARWDAAKQQGKGRHSAPAAPKKQPAKPVTVIPDVVIESLAAPVAAEPVLLLEAVHSPAHYNGTEVYDQMLCLFGKEAVANFCRLNAFKYRMRAGKKHGNSIEQDVSKAIWYEQRLSELAHAA